ncbi:MAG: hypothetical protein E6K54_08960 [Gammaproteobacteria bacterium]|nr:MAG: hypothetical protein E6K54_08960 [Gammaproteobacteria bacterium]
MAREAGVSQEEIKEILGDLGGVEGSDESSNFSLSGLVGNLNGLNKRILESFDLKDIVIQADKA